MNMRISTKHLKTQLDKQLNEIERVMDKDVLSIIGPIYHGLENNIKEAVENITNKKSAIAIIHNTPGGVVEVVERMVTIIRHHYKEVVFLIPDRAMSAGTVFALSGDKIYMDYYSCLGPIDPQIEKLIDNQPTLMPALSYINQYNKLVEKANKNKLNTVEFALFREQFNLPELETFTQALELTEDLLIAWLVKYKFKNWDKQQQTKKNRAREIANKLSDYKLWHSHSRGINKKTLEEIGLTINDFSEVQDLSSLIKSYYELLTDFMQNERMGLFIHNRGYF